MITALCNKKSEDISDDVKRFQNDVDNKINKNHTNLTTIINKFNENIEQLTINNVDEL